MENEEIRKKLMEAKKGGVLFFGGPGWKVMEVVDYKLRTATWRDILCESGGMEAVFEVDASEMVKLWLKCKPEELSESVVFGDDTINFRGEELQMEESGRPVVTVNGEPEGRVPYAVYVGLGATVCLEEWPGEGLMAYYLEREIALPNIDIIYL